MQILKIMEKTFESESNEVALYLAMSQRADEEGHPEVAQYLRQIAMDEAWHAAEFALLLGKIKDTRSNLEIMLEGEIKEEKDKEEAARVALSEGEENAFRIFTWSMHSERSHKEVIRKMLLKLQEKIK
ncbi:rubrerythrin [Candidatus Methanoperedens nitroreducens]|uniref:Rubrerythrin n=1 Tax=Candidatus Methanoperedens nitratireducens TaxID=1392998 RepID=A0A062VAX2_9EURY|nr:ferritin family protein [Candidatus Methanoperedens nitroreducens]KCZ72445.1 rubrerythrin [Candidatus Methanoperedens nitroreducens]MDJ1423621.1 ferritin family protein [Candidatus Methanoperedens sp.]